MFLVLNATFLALLVDIVWEKARGKEERGKEKRKGRERKVGVGSKICSREPSYEKG